MGQLLLIPDPRPLDQRMGGEFFRRAPKKAGVYLMRDATGEVLYVGKAKNLQQRLRHYRVANPDRMPSRHLRMLREVVKIELKFCRGESAALKQEAALIHSLQPRFNRAGKWHGSLKFVTWRMTGQDLELAVVDVPQCGWHQSGVAIRGAGYLHTILSRLLWLAVNPARMFSELPPGWVQRLVPHRVSIHCAAMAEKVQNALENYFFCDAGKNLEKLQSELAVRAHPFERALIEQHMDELKSFALKFELNKRRKQQLALL